MPRAFALALAAAALLVAGCIGFTGDPPNLEGSSWVAVMVGGSPPVADHEPTLTLGPGHVTGSAGCNGYSSRQLSIGGGSYEDGVPIALGEIAGNAGLCEDPAVMDVETAFIEILQDVERLRLDGGQLILEGPHGRLRFERVEVPAVP